jgi:hypothetical protein
MNKDYALKNSAGYDSGKIKSRIVETLKDTRDDADEVKHPRMKSLPIIPVTGSKQDKYLNNKSRRDF